MEGSGRAFVRTPDAIYLAPSTPTDFHTATTSLATEAPALVRNCRRVGPHLTEFGIISNSGQTGYAILNDSGKFLTKFTQEKVDQ